MTGDIGALRRALLGRWTSLLLELLGQPSSKRARQWRWNQHGSLSAVVDGPKVGTWFDHEASTGGGPFELIARHKGGDWRAAADWARHWLGWPGWQQPRAAPINVRIGVETDAEAPIMVPANDLLPDPEVERRRTAQRAAQATWDAAGPVDPDHAYLMRKAVPAFGIRMDSGRSLIIPLVDIDGTIHTIQRIDEEGSKRYLAGGAKAGHFTVIGELADGAPTVLLCEGWATGASAHAATGLPVVAAMDAGNLRLVAPPLRERFPDARIVLLADNDNKPGRVDNPGVTAATAAARAIRGLIAIPPGSGDFNDLALAQGIDAVRCVIDAAAPPAPLVGTYPRPSLDTATARLVLDHMVSRFMSDVANYWNADPLAAVPAFAGAPIATVAADGEFDPTEGGDAIYWDDFIDPAAAPPPWLALLGGPSEVSVTSRAC